MKNDSPRGERERNHVEWENAYPQGHSASTWIVPAVAGAVTLLYLANVGFALNDGSLTPVFAMFSLLFCTSWWLLTASSLAATILANTRANSPTTAEPGKVTITSPVLTEPLLLITAGIAAMAGSGLIMWFEDPFADPPWKSGEFRGALMPYFGVILAILCLAILAARPWRRRLVLTPDALEYRRFGGPVTIPWDSITEITPDDRGVMKAVIIRANPPAELPNLERKTLPDGTTRGTLAIQAMTVDPGTLLHAIRRLHHDPDSRRLLQSPREAETLFTGPSWRERIHMEPGQTWAPPAKQD